MMKIKFLLIYCLLLINTINAQSIISSHGKNIHEAQRAVMSFIRLNNKFVVSNQHIYRHRDNTVSVFIEIKPNKNLKNK